MIYNAPSIYKQGGGGSGGGYKDGGELVDGDFIKVENNSVSSYGNTTRNDVNFYFEVSDGEVINSVVELTTAVNATIHVYIYQNGLYIPLGNVGGDTVNAGDEYNLTIVGNSFILDVVTPAQAYPEYIKLKNGDIVKLNYLVDYNNKKWFSTGNIGDYLTYSQQSQIAIDNNLNFLSIELKNEINNTLADPKSVIGTYGYPGRKYNGLILDLGNTFFSFRNSTYGWKLTNDSNNLIQDAPANSDLAYSCVLFYSVDI